MKDLGPVVPIVTPCNSDGSPDVDGFKSVCADMLQAGCKGIFVAGSTGRGPWFSISNRVKVCKAAVEQTQGKVAVFAGVTSSGLPGMLENTLALADAGAQYAVATVPTYFHYNQAEIEMIYSKFADQSPLPVMVYDIPEYTNVKLANDMVMRLAKHGNIAGFKDSSADLERFKGLIEALQGSKDFYLMQGKENLIAESLKIGASGFIVSLMHIDPRPFVGIYQAVHAGNDLLAQALQLEINKVIKLVRETIDQRPESSTLFHMLNYSLQKRGICQNILLDVDDKAPAWVYENAQQSLDLCNNAAKLIQL
jgi:dihydrodipicolinate synthase/N-acetylneuraminate lyase